MKLSDKAKTRLAKAETHGSTGIGALLLGALLASGVVDFSSVDMEAFYTGLDQVQAGVESIKTAIGSIKFGQLSLMGAVSFILFRHKAPGN